MTNDKTSEDDSAPLYNPEDTIFGANANPELQAKALGLVNKSKKDWAKRKVCKECQCESDPGFESHMAGCSQHMNSICSEHKVKMYGCAKCYPYLITN